MISGTAVAILASLFPKETGLVIGINTTAVYVGTTLGPVLGGFLVNYSGWPALFIFSGAFAFVSAMLALLSLDFSRRSGKRPPRFETLLIFTLSTILTSVGSAHIRSLFGLAALLIGLTTFMFTLYIERRKSLNLVKQIFEKSTFLAYLAALLNYVAIYALTILYSNYLQLEAGFTPWEAGLILLAQPIPQALLSSLAGYLSDKWDPGALAATGMGLIALGIGISIVLYKWLSFLIASLILLGTGFAFFASPNTTQIMRKIPKEAFASASSFLGLMRFLGQSLSTSILTATMLAFKTSVPMKESLTVYLIVAVVGASTAVMSAHRKKT
jgi:MFS family permease